MVRPIWKNGNMWLVDHTLADDGEGYLMEQITQHSNRSFSTLIENMHLSCDLESKLDLAFQVTKQKPQLQPSLHPRAGTAFLEASTPRVMTWMVMRISRRHEFQNIIRWNR